MPGGSGSGIYLSSDTTVALWAYIVDSNAAASTGDTVTYTLYSLGNNQFLDFNDNTFKSSGWGSVTASMTEVSSSNAPGVYRASFSLAAIDEATDDTLIACPVASTGLQPPPIEIRVDQWARDLRDTSAYQGWLWFDSTGGAAGTTIGANGTQANPSSSVANLLTLVGSTGIRQVKVTRTGTLTLGASTQYITFEGDSIASGVALGGQDITGSTFRNLTVIGNGSVTGFGAYFERCFYGAGQTDGGTWTECSLTGTITVAGTDVDLTFVRCTADPTLSVVLDMNGQNTTAHFFDLSGDVAIANMTHASSAIDVALAGGTLTINASCTAGTITVRGLGRVVNNGTSTVVQTGLVDPIDVIVTGGWAGRCIIDGGAGSSAVTKDSQGEVTRARIRVFATAAAASAATKGAANDGDSEVFGAIYTGVAATAGRFDSATWAQYTP